MFAACAAFPMARSPGCSCAVRPRVSAYLRSRDMRPSRGENSIERRWRQTAGSAPMFAWICVLVALLFGSRHLLGGVPGFGEFLRLPVSPRAMLTDYRSGWWGHGLGATTPVPTGVALTALASTATLFHMGLLHTLGVLGLLVIGYLGHLAARRTVPDGACPDRRTRRLRRRAASVAAALQRAMGRAGVLRDGSVGRSPPASKRRNRVVRPRRHQSRRQQPGRRLYPDTRTCPTADCCANLRC